MKGYEQKDRHDQGEYAKWLKRALRKAMRRMAKRDPENAPTRAAYRGFSE